MKIISVLVAMAFVVVTFPAQAGPLKVCVSTGGAVFARPKCKAGETQLSIPDLLAQATTQTLKAVPTPHTLTTTDVNGQISAYLACDNSNQNGTTQYNALIAEQQAISNYADSLDLKGGGGNGSALTPKEQLDLAQTSFQTAYTSIMNGDYSDLSNMVYLASNYLAEAHDYYASSPAYTKIFKSVKTAMSEIAGLNIPGFTPSACGG